jgi:hypothetical protein
MAQEWRELTSLTAGKAIVVERVRMVESGIAIEGEFELPPLTWLSGEDQTFLAAFVRSHGSIKQMEKYFGVSYPTIKNWLNRIAEKLEFIEIDAEPAGDNLFEAVDRGEVSVAEALKRLRQERK